MEKLIMDKEAVVEALADVDPVYQHMMRKQSELEQKFDRMVAQLPDDQRALAWDFVMLCEDMNQRMLYLACKYMDFMNIQNDDIVLPDNLEMQKAAARIFAHKVLNMT